MGKLPDAKKKAEIAAAARHVIARTGIEVTEVIEKDEDRNVALWDRCAAAVAMFFGAMVGLAIIGLSMVVISAKAGAGAVIILGYRGYGLKAATAFVCLFTIGAFLRPTLTLRVFGHLMKPFNDLFGGP